jgi:hypothetical protein
MTNLTAKQIKGLTNMCPWAQRGSLGARINALETSSPVYLSGVTMTGFSTMVYETAPVLGTATYLHTAIILTGATQTITVFAHQPDVPRLLVVSGNQATMNGSVVITGTDFSGAVLTQTLTLNNGTSVPTTKAFASVTSVVVPALAQPGDTVTIGVINKIGFPIAVPYSYLFFDGLFGGSHDAGTGTFAATVNGSYYAPAGSLDGTTKVDLYFAAPE